MPLDFTRPYGEVHGMPGAFYEQGGLYFKADGSAANGIREYIEEPVVKDDSIPPPIACYEQPTPPQEQEAKTLEDMHWRHLKALIESFGGEWTNRENALKFMKGK